MDLAWAAGFLDGEGCFTLVKPSKPTHSSQRALHVSAAQCNIEPLLKLRELFDGKVRQHCRTTEKGTVIYVWLLDGGAPAFRRFLPMVIPYLIGKRRQAEILLEFADTIRRRGRPKKGVVDLTSVREIARRMELIAEMDLTRGRSATEVVISG